MAGGGWLHLKGDGRRRRAITVGDLAGILALAVAPVLVILIWNPWYTPLIHHLAGDSRPDYPGLFHRPVSESATAVVNILASEPVGERSALPTVRLWVRSAEYLALNRLIMRYGFGEVLVQGKVIGIVRGMHPSFSGLPD